MGRPIRVAHVMGHMIGGGVEATVMNHYRHIDRNRVQFDFIVDSDSTVVPRREIESLGGRVFVVPPYRRLARYMKACEALFRETEPDIVHSNINALSVFPLAAARRAGVRVCIAHSHSTANARDYKKTLLKTLLKPFAQAEPTHLAACSRYSARWLFGDAAVNAGRVHIIKNAIDLDHFTFSPEVRAHKRVELGAREGQLVIGQVGRMCFQKNQMFTLDVFKELVRLRSDAMLVFAGDGELMGAVRAKARELSLEQSVRFLGQRDDIAELYQAFDVTVLPSMYEGFGMVAVEAEATGLPVVASDQVPDEARVVPALFDVLPLGDPRRWVKAVAGVDVRDERVSETQIVNSAGYRIEDSADEMCHWYQSLLADPIGVSR